MQLNLLVYGLIGAFVLGAGFFVTRDLLTEEPLVGQCATQVNNVTELKFEKVGCRASKARMSSAEFEVRP